MELDNKKHYPNIKALLGHLSGKVAAELELLERHSHGVCSKEEDEGHKRQIWDILAGIPHQRASVLQTLLLTQLAPVQSCHIQLRGEWVAVVQR